MLTCHVSKKPCSQRTRFDLGVCHSRGVLNNQALGYSHLLADCVLQIKGLKGLLPGRRLKVRHRGLPGSSGLRSWDSASWTHFGEQSALGRSFLKSRGTMGWGGPCLLRKNRAYEAVLRQACQGKRRSLGTEKGGEVEKLLGLL